jgi:hypothetical protein
MSFPPSHRSPVRLGPKGKLEIDLIVGRIQPDTGIQEVPRLIFRRRT